MDLSMNTKTEQTYLRYWQIAQNYWYPKTKAKSWFIDVSSIKKKLKIECWSKTYKITKPMEYAHIT